MKKVLSVCLILIMTAGLFSFTGREAYAKTAGKDDRFSEGGFIFEITDADKKYVMVTGIDPAGKNDSKDKENIILPAEVIHKELTYTVTGIGDAAFAMTGIVSVSIPEGIMAIGDSAFAGCEKLKRVELPASLNRIGNGVFSYCKILDDIVIDDDSEDFIYIKGLLSSVDREKLYWASNSIAGNLTLPEKTVEIMPYAFEGNTYLKKVVMKDGLTSIGKGAFFDCNALTRADIPKTVGSIDGNPFMYCTSLKKIKVNSKNANYRSTSAGLLLNAKKTVLISASAARGELTLPAKIKTVGEGAAAGNTNLTGVIFNTKLTRILPYAFADCTGLEKVTFANRKAVLAEDGMIFKNTPYFMEVSIPYSENAGSEGSIESMVRANSGKGVIITSR